MLRSADADCFAVSTPYRQCVIIGHFLLIELTVLCALRDMPPPGGFESLKYKRNLPFRGPSGLAILGGVTAVCLYGFYRLGRGNIEKRCVHPTPR